ncbi:MAG: phosphohydrolase [Clostridiales bacterium 43-6]|nr:MAG: phosphohydrolase [Clostridiales bacterium 43-6]
MKTNADLFSDIEQHLLNDDTPSEYLKNLALEPYFAASPFSLLLLQKTTGQSKKYHPEGSVWNHTMLVVDAAAGVREYSSDKTALMWAALLHDIGKPWTTRYNKGKITSYHHETVGADLSEKLLTECGANPDLIKKVKALVRWHMQILYVLQNTQFQEIEMMKKETDITEAALLGFCDRVGRTGADREAEEENRKRFIEKCKKIG